jgi:hypothetical protein
MISYGLDSIMDMMVNGVWGVNGIYIVDFLPDDITYNSSYFVEHILNSIVEMKAEIWGESDFFF